MEYKLKKLKDKKLLPPPWIAYPEIERYSIGWRMGYGESYIWKWGQWYNSLANEEQKEYQTLFPNLLPGRGIGKMKIPEYIISKMNITCSFGVKKGLINIR